MDWLQLQSFAIPPLTQGILALVAMGALLRSPQKNRTTWLFFACFGVFFVFYLLVVLQLSVVGPGHFVFAPLLQVVSLLGVTVVLHLAYTFRGTPFPQERRWVVGAGALLSGAGLLYVSYQLARYGADHTIQSRGLFFLYLAGMGWILVVCLRRIWKDTTSDKRWTLVTDSQKALALLGGLTFLSISTGWDADAHVALIAELMYLSGFVLIYVNYSGVRSTVQVKLVTLTLAALLGILGLAALVLYSPQPFTTFLASDGSFDRALYDTYRSSVHADVIKLVYVILGSTVFVLVAFPFMLGRSLIRPLHTLLSGVQRIQGGDLDTHLPSSTTDEWGTLTTSFNTMARSLATAQREIHTYTDDLEQLVDARTREIVRQKEIAEHARTVIEEQAEQLRSLDQAKSHFFANLSHEFRTPLTLIAGPIQDVLDGSYGPVSDDMRLQLERTQHSAERLLRLINQLLELSKLEAGHFDLDKQPGDLVALVKGVLRSFASLAEQRELTLHFKHLPTPAQATAQPIRFAFDRDKMEQVFSNLIANAVKFTPDGGRIRVTIQATPEGAVPTVIIHVRDSGHGIPASEHGRIFDRFYQAPQAATFAQRGTGIGLALTRELIECHGGHISVQSEEGFGSVFTVVLPLEDLPHERASLLADHTLTKQEPLPTTDAFPVLPSAQTFALSPTTQDTNNKPRILLAEDDPDVRAYIHDCLASDYTILEAADGKAALAHLKKETVALVLSDVMMPEMNGYALCQAIKREETLQGLPVILLTAKSDRKGKLDGLATGADDYLFKPFDAKELRARIANLLTTRDVLKQQQQIVRWDAPEAIPIRSADAVFLDRVRQAVERHIGDADFGVDWLADEVGSSPRHLQRKIKAITNLSAASYIRMMRMKHATHLLEQAFGTIAEVAYAVGFRDAKYFSTVFRQHYNVLPSQWAKQAALDRV